MDSAMTFYGQTDANPGAITTSSTLTRLWLTKVKGYRVIRSTQEPRAGLTGIRYKPHWLLERKR